MVIDQKRREMFTDLYKVAEYYERPPFSPGAIDDNADWFVKAQNDAWLPFVQKWAGNLLALELAEAVLNDASRRAVEFNRMEDVL